MKTNDSSYQTLTIQIIFKTPWPFFNENCDQNLKIIMRNYWEQEVIMMTISPRGENNAKRSFLVNTTQIYFSER